MKRTTKRSKPADAILTADFHLTDSTPVSRTDDYMKAQETKLAFLQTLSDDNNNCPILCAGDVFHNWKASPWLSSWAWRHLPSPLVAIPGNHDLPMHSLEHYDKSALSLLEEVSFESFVDLCGVLCLMVLKEDSVVFNGCIKVTGVRFGKLEKFTPVPGLKRNILMLHELVWPDKKPGWGKEEDWTAQQLLKKYGDHFDLILTGDNHESFVVEDRKTGSLLVNPGSMMRINADQENYQPECYLYYAEENKVCSVPFPIEKGVHNRDHIDQKKDRDERIAAYIERMNQDWKISLDFSKNLQAFFSENNTNRKVREIVWQHLEAEET